MCVGFWAGVTYLRYTVLTSPKKGETTVHCCDPTLSVLVMLVSRNVFRVVSALQSIACLQNCNNFFRPKKMNSSPLSVHFWAKKRWNFSERDCTVFFKKQPLHYESQHVLLMTTAASCKTRLDAIMISRCQGDDTCFAFQPLGIFRYWRNGEFPFSKDVYSPSVFLGPHPLPSQVFRFALASSSLAILSACSAIG